MNDLRPATSKPTPASALKTSNQPPENPQPGKVATAFGMVIVIGILALIIWGVAAAIGAGMHAAKTASKTTPTPTPSVSKTPTPAPTNTTAEQVSNWYTKYGASVIAAFSTDAAAIGNDAKNSDVNTMQTDCQKMSTDLTSAQSDPPMPDSNLEKDWSSALADYQSSAQDCNNGINEDDANLISQAATEMTNGNTAIQNVTAGINALSK